MKFMSGIFLCIFLFISITTAIPADIVKEDDGEVKEVIKEDNEVEAIANESDEKVKEAHKCGECNPKKCPSANKCLAGLVRDRCGCCDICGLEEGQLCNNDGESADKADVWYGRCGTDLECRLRNEVGGGRSENQSVCFCVKDAVFCGSDMVTYSSYCKLQAAIVNSDGKIVLESHGPCKTKPKIISKAKNQEVKEKSDISLRCETEAYPLPQFQWTFTRPNGLVKILPDDDTEISISTRGGPLPYQVTSHLLITNIQLRHEGTYGCIVSNEKGMDQMLVRLVVSSKDDNDGKEEI